MKRKKSFQIETEAQFKVLSNTNYGSHYNEIFENNDLKLNKLMLAMNKLDIHLSNDSKTNYRDENNGLIQDNAFFNSIYYHSLGNENSLSHKTSNMADFDMLQPCPL